MKLIKVLISLHLLFAFQTSQGQVILQLQMGIGDQFEDFAVDIVPSGDGNFLCAGRHKSASNVGANLLLKKIDSLGGEIWTQVYNRPLHEVGNRLLPTMDGNFLISGQAEGGTQGGFDFYLIKIDPSGGIIWETMLGSPNWDIENYGIVNASDSGFVVSGSSNGNVLVVKTNASGVVEWNHSFDTGQIEYGHALCNTVDGGYVVGGTSRSQTNEGFLFKLDSAGNRGWTTTFAHVEWAWKLIPTSDSCFVLTGWGGNEDIFLRKFDSLGDSVWYQTYGGPLSYGGYEVLELLDGGYMLAGEGTIDTLTGIDGVVVRTDSLGNELWRQNFGGQAEDFLVSLLDLGGRQFMGVGYTKSFGNVNGFPDTYIVRFRESESLSQVVGKVFADHNGNCMFDVGIDEPVANRLVKAEPGPFYVYSDSLGNYSLRLDPGAYTLSKDSSDGWPLAACAPNALTVNADLGVNGPYDFPLMPPLDSCDLSIGMVGAPNPFDTCVGGGVYTTPCPGHLFQYCVSISNNSGTFISSLIDSSAIVRGILPMGMNFVYPGGGCIQFSGDSTFVGVLVDTLQAGDTCQACFWVSVSSSANVSNTYVSANLDLDCSNDSTSFSSASWYNGDSCSCDPNDMVVLPKGCGTYGAIDKEETLSYRIRFENTGAGPAHLVVVRDSLSRYFDLGTLRVVGSSHTITALQINPGNELVVSFKEIELQPGEKGFLQIALDLLPGIPNESVVTNQAAIYFDRMPPVITNEVFNTVIENPSPVVGFSLAHSETNPGAVYDFIYSGTVDPGQSYLWDFGPDASPSTSVSLDPGEVTFLTPGPTEVRLVVNRNGCVSMKSDSLWPESYLRGKKVVICHRGRTKHVAIASLSGHLGHGDVLGLCDQVSKTSPRNNVVEFKAYPNPFSETIDFEFFLTERGHACLEIIDPMGREIETRLDEFLVSGIHQVRLRADRLAPGLYFAVLTMGNERYVTTVVKK